MRNCPVCGETFGDELNFCDVDGSQLERDPADVAQDKNKLWSILGVALVVGALVISAMSIIFLPKGRVSSPASVSSQPQPSSTPETKLATAETPSNAEPSSVSSEPGTLSPPDSVPPELKKKDAAAPGHENANLSKSAKAAAQSGEEAEKPAPEPQPPTPAPVTAKKPETPSAKTAGEKHEAETPRATAQPAADPKSAGAKPAENSNKKKGGDDKDKKKGGFFKVFKKIFGKD